MYYVVCINVRKNRVAELYLILTMVLVADFSTSLLVILNVSNNDYYSTPREDYDQTVDRQLNRK